MALRRQNSGPFYPVSLDLAGVKVLVVGGGAVALRKARGLVQSGANVTVVAPTFAVPLRKLRGVRRVARKYRASDLSGARLVFAATDDAALNGQIAAACRRRGLLVNVATPPDAGNMQIPASVRRGQFCIAVSTGGASAALAAAWRAKLETLAGPEWGQLLALLNRQRQRALREIRDAALRRDFLQALGRPEWARQIKRHGVKSVAKRMAALMRKFKVRA